MDKVDPSEETHFHQTPQKDPSGEATGDYLRDYSTPLKGKLSFGDDV